MLRPLRTCQKAMFTAIVVEGCANPKTCTFAQKKTKTATNYKVMFNVSSRLYIMLSSNLLCQDPGACASAGKFCSATFFDSIA